MVDFYAESPRKQARLHRDPFHRWAMPDGTTWAAFYRTDGGYLLRFPDLADFEISADGVAVVVVPSPDVSDTTLQHLYLNQVLPLMQSKAGKLVFHASAVEVGDGAVALVAASGGGKSTLAASFAVCGFRFLTDDGLVVELSDGVFQAQPSHPSIRLWADSEEALIPPSNQKADSLPFTSKARLLAGEKLRFCSEPRPLRGVYFLGDGSAVEPTIQRVIASDAVMKWVEHSFFLDVQEQRRLATHFDQVTRLASLPMHYLLDYPRRFEALEQVRQAIVNHARKGVPQ